MSGTNKSVAVPRDRITIKYAATYYFVSQFDRYVNRDLILDYFLSDYFAEAMLGYIRPFNKWTALHKFASLYAEMVLDADYDRATQLQYVRLGSCDEESCNRYPLANAHLLAVDLSRIHKLDPSPLGEALEGWVRARDCCLQSGQPMDIDVLDEAWSEWRLIGGNEEIAAQMAEEMFFVLFANRSFLSRFNEHMAARVSSLVPDENDKLLTINSDGETILKRKEPPQWAKRAVFFRDRGYCCGCGRNLENSRSPINRAHYDHIVPLAAGGLNDVSNLQLMCESCNGKKSDRRAAASDLYERWYKIDRNHNLYDYSDD
jgi:hypothetical protein